MDRHTEKKISKFLSYVLRHNPDDIGLVLDDQGWALTEDLIAKVNSESDITMTSEDLKHVVSNNDKKRFLFSPDGQMIRANQGHSIQVDLGLTATAPPERLFHGTALINLDSIRQKGLQKGQRHHVHLSPDTATAKNVGGRHGKPVVLAILSEKMHEADYKFFQSDNGVWLTDHVPVDFIEFPT